MKLLGPGTGQSLIELLIAVTVGTVLAIIGLTVISPALKSSSDVGRLQVATALGKQLLDNIRVFAEADWHNLVALTPGQNNHYYLNTSASPFTAVNGEETVVVATSTYQRYFYYENVNRDPGGNIVTGSGADDPSTKKVTVFFRWQDGPWYNLVTYLIRRRNQVLIQSDWSAGPQGEVVSSSSIGFATSTNISHTEIPGSVKIPNLNTQ